MIHHLSGSSCLVFPVLFVGAFYAVVPSVITATDGPPQHQFQWTPDDNSLHHIAEVTDIEMDMAKLSAMESRILDFEENSTDFVSLSIDTSSLELEGVEACSHLANKLLLQLDSVHKSVPLVCGNEIVEIHTTRFPFKLVFIKGKGVGRPQLDRFNITLGRGTTFPHDKYNKGFVATRFPKVLYSPFYPAVFPGDLRLNTIIRQVDVVLFQLRARQTGTNLHNQVRVFKKETGVGGENKGYLLNTDRLYTLVHEPFIPEDFVVHFDVTDNKVDVYELEYRVLGSDKIACKSNSIPDTNLTYDVTQPTKMELEIGRNVDRCNVTFKAKPNQALVFTSISDGSCRICGTIKVLMYIGDDLLQAKAIGFPNFGIVRAPPGQDVKISVIFDLISLTNYLRFMVEAYEKDALPETLNALDRPSYIWTPGWKDGAASPRYQVRSLPGQCVTFTVLDQHMDNTGTLGDFMDLYSGSGEEGNFKLTENCFGERRNERAIENGRYQINTAVSKVKSPFWLVISKPESTNCTPPVLDLEISSTDTEYSLFSRISFTRHMDCLFRLPPISSSIQNLTDTKFRGHLIPKDGTQLRVADGLASTSNTLLDFLWYGGSTNWVFTNHTIYIHFVTGYDVSADMASFQYAPRYSASDKYQPLPACPGPHKMTLTSGHDMYLETPDYPSHLEQSMSCSWRLRKPVNRSDEFIHVSIDPLHLPCYPSETELYIRGVPKTDNKRHKRKVCGGPYYEVFPDDVKIKLDGGMEHLTPGIRFHVKFEAIEYTKDCNITHFIKQDSPSFQVSRTFEPGHYLVPFQCGLTFDTRDSGVYVRAAILYEEAWMCHRVDNELTVYDGPTITGNSSDILIPRCNETVGTVLSSSNRLKMVMSIMEVVDTPVTFRWIVETVKSEDWIWEGKTRHLYAGDDVQYFTSPGYPYAFQTSMMEDRQWSLSGLDGSQVEMEIQQMDLEYDTKCLKDAVVVYDGLDTDAAVLSRICGNHTSRLKLRSSHQGFYIRFHGNKPDATSNDPPTVGKFKIGFYTQPSPSSDVKTGQNLVFNGREDSGGISTTFLIIMAVLCCVLVVLFVLVAVCVVGRRRNKARDTKTVEVPSKEQEPLQAKVDYNPPYLEGEAGDSKL